MLDASLVLRALRQRYPVLMVDAILEFESRRRVVGVKNVSGNETVFVGHFPGEPVLPGAMIIESAAQTASFLYYDPDEPDAKLDMLLGAVKEMRFLRPVVPGDRMLITAEALRVGETGAAARVEVSVEGRIAAAGELYFVRRGRV